MPPPQTPPVLLNTLRYNGHFKKPILNSPSVICDLPSVVGPSTFARILCTIKVAFLLTVSGTRGSILFSHNHCLLCATHTHSIATCFAVVPSLRHVFLFFNLYHLSTGNSIFYLNSYIHLLILIFARRNATSFFLYRPGLTFMQHSQSKT